MSKLKKIVATLIAATTVATLSVGAMAANYEHYAFAFKLGSNKSAFSSAAIKQDDLNYAKANCKEGNLDSSFYVWLSVYDEKNDAPNTRVSYYKKAKSLENYQLDYTKVMRKNYKCYLKAETDTYGAQVEGKWDP